jgi:hypothetical protein
VIRLKTLPSKEYGLEAATSSIISGSQTSNGRSDDYLKPKTATAVETNWSVSDLFTITDKDSKAPTTIHEAYTSGPLIMHKLDSLRQDLRMFFSKRNTSVPETSSKRDIPSMVSLVVLCPSNGRDCALSLNYTQKCLWRGVKARVTSESFVFST